MKRNLIFASLLAICTLFTACNFEIVKDYPADYVYWEWDEISKSDAENLWNGYSDRKISSGATVWDGFYQNVKLFKDQKVLSPGDYESEYRIDINDFYTVRVTRFSGFDDLTDAKFFRAKRHPGFVMIEYRDGTGDVCAVYEKGWLREERTSRGEDSFEYIYIEYK